MTKIPFYHRLLKKIQEGEATISALPCSPSPTRASRDKRFWCFVQSDKFPHFAKKILVQLRPLSFSWVPRLHSVSTL